MPDSMALLFSSPWQGATGLWRVELDGKISQLGFGQEAGDLSIAAKGDRLVFAQEVTDSNIWRTSGPTAMDRVEPHRLIASTRDDWAPDYSPTSDRIALISDRSGKVQLWLCDGEGQDCSQYETEGWTSLPCWSPDGSRIAFSQDVGGQFDIFVGDSRGGFPRRLTRAESRDHAPVWSPDGHWIYYQSGRGDADQIWRVPAEGGEPEQVTTTGGTDPAVSGDDRYILLLEAEPSSEPLEDPDRRGRGDSDPRGARPLARRVRTLAAGPRLPRAAQGRTGFLRVLGSRHRPGRAGRASRS